MILIQMKTFTSFNTFKQLKTVTFNVGWTIIRDNRH